MASPSFWDKPDAAQRIVQEVKTLKGWTQPYADLRGRLDAARELVELLASEHDDDMEREVVGEAAKLEQAMGQLEIKALMHEEEDHLGAIMTIHPGAGGTESQDWAEMLMRMYLRWTERRGFGREIIDVQPGDEAGIKSATFTVTGDYAYGLDRKSVV